MKTPNDHARERQRDSPPLPPLKLESSIEIPGWHKKLSMASVMQLVRWESGKERPPQMVNGFINFDADNADFKQKVEALGVVFHSTGGGINTGNIPWSHLQDVCELEFVKSVSFAQTLKMLNKGPL